MSRLIDADALIEQIKIDSKGNEGQYGDEWLFMDTIENAPTIDAVSEWIPCEVALPSESGRYLVTIADVFGNTEMCVIWFAHEDDYYSDYSEWREITDDVTVIAWMPLPNPYERSDT